MAKDNEGNGPSDGNNLSTPSSSGRPGLRSRPYDANNSFVRKVATKVTDLIPQKSWISRWFDNSQDDATLQNPESEDPFIDKQPPLKRPCIRMDVTHPPGTFTITPRNRNLGSDSGPSKEQQFSNHNDTTRDFLEPSTSGQGIPRFVSSTPAYSADTGKISDNRPTLNMLMSRPEEQNNNGPSNGTDDHSESSESTSGCSSLIPQNNRQGLPANVNYSSPFGSKRRYIDEKLSFTNHLQSPRSLFLDNSNRDTLSSRRPSFNSLMISNSLTRSNSLASPFYNGNTTFGGANAANLYRRSNSVLSEPAPYQMKRTNVEVNPSSESTKSDLSGMSHTARRIMQALEQFSSPLSDVKKIPMRNVMGGSSSDSTFNLSPTTSRKRAREDETSSPRVGLRHLTRELPVPSVPELLRIRRRQKLQNTTVNARKIMTARSNATVPAPQEYHIRTEADVEPKRNTQLKAKKKTKLEEEETVEAVNLPTIPLPISNLPRFDIALPQYTKSSSNFKPSPRPADKSSDSFKFASPIKLSEGAKNLESINNFIFSNPMSPSKISSANDSQELSKTLSVTSSDNLSFSSGAPSFPNFTWAGPTQTLKPKEKVKPQEKVIEPSGLKVASELKSGSVMDFFMKKSSPSPTSDSSNVWECNECLIKNNVSESYCVACKSPRPDTSSDIEILECPSDSQDSKSSQPSQEDSKPTKNSTTSLTAKFNSTSNTASNTNSKAEPIIIDCDDEPPKKVSPVAAPTASPLTNAFKPAKSSWECPCCMVRNTDSVSTCPCCNTAKPGSVNISPKRTKSDQVAASTTSTTSTSATSTWGSQFKKPEGSWSCDTCMIQNKPEVDKCAACETPKPGAAPAKTAAPAMLGAKTSFSGFGDKFKKPEGTWSCDSCMLQNKSDTNTCVACETPKPGTPKATTKAPAIKGLQFNVSMPANVGDFSFGIDKAGDAAKQATTRTPTLPTANGFSFGSNANKTTSATGFSFGVPSTDKPKEGIDSATKSPAFAFKPSEAPPAAAATFQFGSKSAESKDKEGNKPAVVPSFSFGAPAKAEEKSTSAGFVFGTPAAATPVENKSDEKKEPAKAPTGSFLFGASAAASPQANKASSMGLSESTQPKEEPKPQSSAPTLAGSFLFGSPKPAADARSTENQAKPSPAPTFGTSIEQKPAATTFSFGSPAAQSTTATPAASSASLFTFTGQQKSGDATTQNVTPLPAFGSVAAPKPTFSFGKAAEAKPANVQPVENKLSINFGAAATSPSFGSQTNQPTPSLFGNVSATPPLATNLGENKPLFGAPENRIAPPAYGASTENKPLPTFGSRLGAKPTTPAFPAPAANAGSPFGSSTPSVFGTGTASAFGANASSPSIFAASNPAETTPAATPGLFAFGQSSQPPVPASGGFNFSTGSNAAVSGDQQKSTGLFSFGGSNTGPVGNGFGGGSSFGAPSPAAPVATSNFTFNAPPKPEVPSAITFGQSVAPNATPMLNATATPAQPVGGGFNFGNAGVPNSFSFGSQAPAPTTGGFNFNAPNNPAAAPIAFNPNATPTFNFTAGSGTPTTFNATPQRIIKKAVRRIPRP